MGLRGNRQKALKIVAGIRRLTVSDLSGQAPLQYDLLRDVFYSRSHDIISVSSKFLLITDTFYRILLSLDLDLGSPRDVTIDF